MSSVVTDSLRRLKYLQTVRWLSRVWRGSRYPDSRHGPAAGEDRHHRPGRVRHDGSQHLQPGTGRGRGNSVTSRLPSSHCQWFPLQPSDSLTVSQFLHQRMVTVVIILIASLAQGAFSQVHSQSSRPHVLTSSLLTSSGLLEFFFITGAFILLKSVDNSDVKFICWENFVIKSLIILPQLSEIANDLVLQKEEQHGIKSKNYINFWSPSLLLHQQELVFSYQATCSRQRESGPEMLFK